jgi:hypothetical protein
LFRLPIVVAAIAIYVGTRFLSARRQRDVVRLRNGRRIKLVSSVALLDGSDGSLLALEYLSELPDADEEELRVEARSLIQTVGGRAEYATCCSALVSVRRHGEGRAGSESRDLTFTFFRGDSGSEWMPVDRVG